MEILLILLFLSASCVIVGYPLLQRTVDSHLTRTSILIRPGISTRSELLEEALDNLDVDYRLGKISSEDYGHLKARYEREMLAIGESLARRSHIESKAIDEAIEREVRRAREKRGTGGRENDLGERDCET